MKRIGREHVCIIYSVISSIKFASGKEMERILDIFSVISSIKFAIGKELERSLGRHRTRTSYQTVVCTRMEVDCV